MEDLTYKHQVQDGGAVVDASMVTAVLPDCECNHREGRTENQGGKPFNARDTTSHSPPSAAAAAAAAARSPIDPPATSIAYDTDSPPVALFDSSSDDGSSSSSNSSRSSTCSIPMAVEATSEEETVLTPPLPPRRRPTRGCVTTTSRPPTRTTHLAPRRVHSPQSTAAPHWTQEQQLLQEENALLRRRIALQERIARARSAELQGRTTTTSSSSTFLHTTSGNDDDDVELVMLQDIDDNDARGKRSMVSQKVLARPSTFVRAHKQYKATDHVDMVVCNGKQPRDGSKTVADTNTSSFTLPSASLQEGDTEEEEINTTRSRSLRSLWILVLVTCLVAVSLLYLVVERATTTKDIMCHGYAVSTTTRIDNTPFPVSTLPTCLGQLTRLTYLAVPNVGLSGSLPSQMGQLTLLTWLTLPGNRLTGTLPPAWSRLTQLERLSLADNELEGTIPHDWAASLTSLTRLTVHKNRLTGTIPTVWVPEMLGDDRLYVFSENNFSPAGEGMRTV